MDGKVDRIYEYDVNDLFKPCQYSGEVDYEVVGHLYKNSGLIKTGTP
jgi:hypothetical protein